MNNNIEILWFKCSLSFLFAGLFDMSSDESTIPHTGYSGSGSTPRDLQSQTLVPTPDVPKELHYRFVLYRCFSWPPMSGPSRSKTRKKSWPALEQTSGSDIPVWWCG